MRDLTIISKIALIATKNISFEEQMNLILETIGRYLQVSRSYIFIDDETDNTTSNKFEWCNIGIKSEINKNQNISYNDVPSFRKMLKSGGLINMENIKLLPEDISSMLEAQSIRSISIYPLKIKNEIRGFVGFDECEKHRSWNKSEQRILETLSGIISNIALSKNLSIDMEKTRLKSIIESSNIGTWEWKVDSGKITINEIWLKLIGYNFNDFDVKKINNWLTLLHVEDKNKVIDMLRKHMKKEIDFYDIDYRMKHKNGHWVWINDRGKVIQWTDDGKPLRMFGVHTDITEKKIAENKIKEISIRDSLTNIYNRRYIYERLSIEISRSIREKNEFSVAILDIDRFKDINDNYGHIAGDYILKEFTKLILENLRTYDLLGRYGGEEFIIVLSGLDKKRAGKIIQRILDAIRVEIFFYNSYEISFTFSGGIADITEFSYANISNEEIISLADKRLYEAKNGGRNRIKY